MHVLRTQTAGLTCDAERSTHGSTGPSGRPLQTDLRDGCTRRCTSAWASWKEVYERPSSRCADPRLVVTHRFSWAQWCKGWKTLPSYQLEGPVSSRPSPVGQGFPHMADRGGVWVCGARLPASIIDRGCLSSLWWCSRTAHCCLLARGRMSGVRSWSVHDSPCPLGTQRQRQPLPVETFETTDYPSGSPPGERDALTLSRSSSLSLWVARLEASCSSAYRQLTGARTGGAACT